MKATYTILRTKDKRSLNICYYHYTKYNKTYSNPQKYEYICQASNVECKICVKRFKKSVFIVSEWPNPGSKDWPHFKRKPNWIRLANWFLDYEEALVWSNQEYKKGVFRIPLSNDGKTLVTAICSKSHYRIEEIEWEKAKNIINTSNIARKLE